MLRLRTMKRDNQMYQKCQLMTHKILEKATDFKFGQYINRVYPNKSPLKILEKRECGHIQGLPRVFKYPLLSRERVKL